MRLWQYLLLALIAGFGLAILWAFFGQRQTIAPTVNNRPQSINQSTTSIGNDNQQPSVTTPFSTNDLPDRDPAFDFSAALPLGWAAQYVEVSRAINFFDPRATGTGPIEQSRIFVTSEEGVDFPRASGPGSSQRRQLSVGGRQAVEFERQGETATAGQPTWLAPAHPVVEIRITQGHPTRYYIFARAPDLPTDTFEAFLRSLDIPAETAAGSPLIAGRKPVTDDTGG
ncbi:MAG: hypothetical protein HYY50_02260 [Candidatus Kerfeldbacteria bacterium]|nr:hypothetical protein [Candidatus Kerfeldbacteria bacterium]